VVAAVVLAMAEAEMVAMKVAVAVTDEVAMEPRSEGWLAAWVACLLDALVARMVHGWALGRLLVVGLQSCQQQGLGLRRGRVQLQVHTDERDP
jgi:hypothetical protein